MEMEGIDWYGNKLTYLVSRSVINREKQFFLFTRLFGNRKVSLGRR